MKSCFLILLFFSFLSLAGQKKVSPDTTAMMNRIRYFASAEHAGRLPGHKGYNVCANHAADYFEELKMFPFSGKTWFQPFSVELNEIMNPYCSIQTGDTKKTLKPGYDYAFRGYTGQGSVNGEIVFCGYGLSQPDDGYDDYAGVDVKDKVVMIFKQNPSWQIRGIKWEGSTTRFKVALAKEHGAKAVVFVNSPSSGRTKPIGSMSEGSEPHNADVPALEIATALADEILSEKKQSLAQLQAKIDTLQLPVSIHTSSRADISLTCRYKADAQTNNVIACFPGTDPLLKEEYVIVSAHLDHVGFQGDSLYYPGANDNASGSSIVMEVASMWRKSRIKPARTVVFVLFSCEEHGLFGAKYLAGNFPGDTNKITAILNIDCAGHGDSLMMGGGKSAPLLWKYAKEMGGQRPVSERTWYGGGADAQPFFEMGVPALYFATVNSYTYLHMSGDTPATINPSMLELTADIVFKTSVRLASKEYVKEKIAEP